MHDGFVAYGAERSRGEGDGWLDGHEVLEDEWLAEVLGHV
jgi:hypothetical protein